MGSNKCLETKKFKFCLHKGKVKMQITGKFIVVQKIESYKSIGKIYLKMLDWHNQGDIKLTVPASIDAKNIPLMIPIQIAATVKGYESRDYGQSLVVETLSVENVKKGE
jgi:hypothetical protein